MTNPLTSKLLALGLSGVLGGAGLALGPEITPALLEAAADQELLEVSAPLAAMLDEEGLDAGDLESMLTAAGEAEGDEAAEADHHARREAAHARVAARKAERGERGMTAEARAARRAILADRPEAGEGRRGLDAEARSNLRALRPAHAVEASESAGRARAERPERAERPAANERSARAERPEASERGAPGHARGRAAR